MWMVVAQSNSSFCGGEFWKRVSWNCGEWRMRSRRAPSGRRPKVSMRRVKKVATRKRASSTRGHTRILISRRIDVLTRGESNRLERVGEPEDCERRLPQRLKPRCEYE